MSRDANLAFDNHYNRRLQDMISNLDNMDVLQHQPIMFGGGPLRSHILPAGQLGHYPPIEMLAELQAMGGGQAGTKKSGFAKAVRTYGRSVKPIGKTIAPLKKALVEEAVGQLQYGGRANTVKKTGFAKALRTYGRAVKPLGKTIAPLKKALVEEAVGQLKYGGKMKKGSPEMKAHMARLRAMRK
jgi:hypothetical protein